MNLAAVQEEPSPIVEVLEHLVPHKYGWAPAWEVGGIDLTISNAVINIFLSAGLVILLFWLAASKPRIVPRRIQNFVEFAMDFVKDQIVYSVMSPADARVWGPLIATIFFFVLFMNVIGLVPIIGFTPTGSIFVTAALAVEVYLLSVFVGMAKNGPLKYWKSVLIPAGLPGKNPIVRGFATIFFLIIETISHVFRPVSLAVRLFANMLADHIILLIFVGFIFLVGAGSFAIAHIIVIPIAMVFELIFTGFALMVAVIQAVIFSYLSAIYLNEALHPEH